MYTRYIPPVKAVSAAWAPYAISTSKGFAEDDISENNPDDISMEETSEFELLFGVRVLLQEHINIANINVSIKVTVFLSENTLIPLYYVLMVF